MLASLNIYSININLGKQTKGWKNQQHSRLSFFPLLLSISTFHMISNVVCDPDPLAHLPTDKLLMTISWTFQINLASIPEIWRGFNRQKNCPYDTSRWGQEPDCRFTGRGECQKREPGDLKDKD